MSKLYKILENDAILVNKKIKLDDLLEKHIIISGASGLIGINLLMAIKEFNKNKTIKQLPKVTAIFQNEIPNYFKEILDFKNLIIKRGDIADPSFVESLDEADYIVHAAGYGQPGKFMQDKIKTIAINTTATIWLLKKLKSNGKFLFISTSELYSGAKPPHNEETIGTTTPQHPRACYIEGKRCGEAICMAYRNQGYDVKIARLALAYGPGTKKGDSRVLNQLIEKGLKGDIPLLDKGESERTYCYIEDAIEMLLCILFYGSNSVYNVGGTSNVTILALAKMIANITGSKVILGENSIIGSPDNVKLDLSRTLSEFPRKFIDLKDGLTKTINYQKEIYE